MSKPEEPFDTPSSEVEQDADEVGYCKPPKHTQFKKGQSGNPKGRARGRANAATVLKDAVSARVTIVEGGRRVKRSKLVIAFTQLANKIAAGDLKALGMFLRLLPLLDASEVAELITPDLAADRELARKLAERYAAHTLVTTKANDE